MCSAVVNGLEVAKTMLKQVDIVHFWPILSFRCPLFERISTRLRDGRVASMGDKA